MLHLWCDGSGGLPSSIRWTRLACFAAFSVVVMTVPLSSASHDLDQTRSLDWRSGNLVAGTLRGCSTRVKSLIEDLRCPVPREALQHSARHEIKDFHGALLSSRTRTAVLMLSCAGIARAFSWRNGRRFPLLRRNNSLIQGANTPRLGVRGWGDIIMTDSEWWKERRNQVARYRAMEQETTDPLAARLLHDIVLDLEAELEGLRQSVGLDAAA